MTEFVRAKDGVDIAFDKAGNGPPVILVHGFAASRSITWKNTGWYEWLVGSGRSVIALDCRGHGESGKPRSAKDYDDRIMAADIVAVMEANDAASAPLIGYSMGGYLLIALMHIAPERVQRAVLGGVGENYFSFWEGRDERIAQGLEAADSATLSDPLAIEFRAFAERAGNDLGALAACMRRTRISCTAQDLGRMLQPTLVVCGEDDPIAGHAAPLAAYFPNGEAVSVPRRNHHSTVGDRLFKEAVRDFLDLRL